MVGISTVPGLCYKLVGISTDRLGSLPTGWDLTLSRRGGRAGGPAASVLVCTLGIKPARNKRCAHAGMRGKVLQVDGSDSDWPYKIRLSNGREMWYRDDWARKGSYRSRSALRAAGFRGHGMRVMLFMFSYTARSRSE